MLAMMSPFHAPLASLHMAHDDILCQPMRMADAMADALLNAQPGCRLTRAQPTVTECDDKFVVTIECAGVSADDIQLESHGTVLSAKGITKTASNSHFVDYRVALPGTADFSSELIAAECVDGILTVSVPKRPPTTLSIAVETTPVEDGDREEADKADKADKYSLTVVAAGIAAADLALSVDERGLLTVSGESKRTGARLDRRYRLPSDADRERVRAAHVDGILTVSVPKTSKDEQAVPRKIAVTKAAAGKKTAAAMDDDAVLV